MCVVGRLLALVRRKVRAVLLSSKRSVHFWETVGTCKMKSYSSVAVEQEERALLGDCWHL